MTQFRQRQSRHQANNRIQSTKTQSVKTANVTHSLVAPCIVSQSAVGHPAEVDLTLPFHKPPWQQQRVQSHKECMHA